MPASRLALNYKAAAAGAAFSWAAAVPLNQAADVGQAVGAAARPNQLAAGLLGQGRRKADAADGRRPCKEGRVKGPQGRVQWGGEEALVNGEPTMSLRRSRRSALAASTAARGSGRLLTSSCRCCHSARVLP